MNLIRRILNGVEKVVSAVAAILLGIMVINTSAGVFYRYVLNNALPWTDELGRYLMIWMGFFGCYLAVRSNSHVGVEMVVKLFGPRIQKALEVLAKFVVIAFLVAILSQSSKQLGLLGIQTSSALEIPMAIPYAAVTFGVLMMLVENIAQALFLLVSPRERRSAAEEG